MKTNDSDFYADPANLEPGKRVTPEERPTLSGHIPVRFPESLIERIKALATGDGLTVSSWVRRLVINEIERRTTPQTVANSPFTIIPISGFETSSHTESTSEDVLVS